ncbi:hypothetical protein, partial [Burkholderia vietnamiensis]|uniref:hypothetical protein n=1 Tax=Burkholderia vietnamiensis TaxID=60552 RepID=UPI001ABA4B5D
RQQWLDQCPQVVLNNRRAHPWLQLFRWPKVNSLPKRLTAPMGVFLIPSLIASVCCCIAIALFEPACARRFSGNDIGRIR